MPVEGGGNAVAPAKKKAAPKPVVAPPVRPDDRPGPRGADPPPAYVPPPSGGGGGGGGDGSDPGSPPDQQDRQDTYATSTAPPPAIDWQSVLGLYGLPDDLVSQLDAIWRQYNSNPDIATTLALGTIRGSQWYATTYAGIQKGINNGLFSDERGYRAYQNDVNQVYRQYWNRDATSAEVSTYMTAGKSVNRVAAEFQSQAIRSNFSDPLKAEFSEDELAAFADQQAGIDSALGQKIAAEADLFTKIAPLYQNFYGRTVTRDDLDQLLKNGTSAQQVAQSFAVEENINAMNPAVRDLFTTDEIRQVALDQAGGITPKGGSLKALMDLSLQLNPIYHQYTGAGVSRQDIENAYSTGLTADTVGRQFAGKAYIDANQSDIQQNAGAFGENGQLTADQLKAFGEETAGLDTPQGQAIAAAYQKTLTRLHGAFKGALASPALSLASGRLAGPGANQPPDIAA